MATKQLDEYLEKISDGGSQEQTTTEEGTQQSTESQVREQNNTEQQQVQGSEQQVQENQEQQAQQVDFSQHISTAFDGRYQSFDEIKNDLDKLKEFETLTGRVGEYEKQVNEYKDLLEQANNPRDYFANEKLFKLNQISKDNPDLSPFVLNQLLDSENVDEMDDLQALILQRVKDVPSMQRNVDDVRRSLERKYGLNVNPATIEDDDERRSAEEQLRLNKVDMQLDAAKAKKEFKSLLDIKLPEAKNIEQIKADREARYKSGMDKLKNDFTPIAQGLSKDLTKIDITYPDGSVALDYQLSDKDKESLSQGIIEAALRMNMNPGNKDDIQRLGAYAKNSIIVNNLPRILKAHEENIIARMKNNEYQKHNVTDAGDLTRTGQTQGFDETNDDIVRREIGKRRDMSNKKLN